MYNISQVGLLAHLNLDGLGMGYRGEVTRPVVQLIGPLQ